jgi:hypothetical protein
MTAINLGGLTWRGAILFVSACSAPLSLDQQPEVATALAGDAGPAGGPSVSFADSLEKRLGWWFGASAQGNGYVSRRAEARSPNHVGDLYSNRTPAGQWVGLSKRFTLPATTLTGCAASIWIDPFTDVTGDLEIDDAATKAQLRSGSFSLAGTRTWTQVSTGGEQLGSPTGNGIIVRVHLWGNGAWQEFLFDDLSGSCTTP